MQENNINKLIKHNGWTNKEHTENKEDTKQHILNASNTRKSLIYERTMTEKEQTNANWNITKGNEIKQHRQTEPDEIKKQKWHTNKKYTKHTNDSNTK